jgi:hypothetical protein
MSSGHSVEESVAEMSKWRCGSSCDCTLTPTAGPVCLGCALSFRNLVACFGMYNPSGSCCGVVALPLTGPRPLMNRVSTEVLTKPPWTTANLREQPPP